MRQTAGRLGATLLLALVRQPMDARPQPAGLSSCAGQSGDDVDQLLADLAANAEEYTRVYRDLTAEETKTTELYRASGEVEGRRQVVSDLLLYRASRDGKDAVTEYRDVRSVDGKAIEHRGERALTLLTKAAHAGSLERELKAINEETRRYEFRHRHLQGVTLGYGVLPKEWRQDYQVEITGHDQIAGRDVIVLAYRKTSPSRSRLPLPRELRDVELRDRGRLWIDARTCQIWRNVWELAVPHSDASALLVMIHFDRTFQPSRFGIMVPERLVFDWLDRFSHPKDGRPSFSLTERTTFTYGEFRRFGVTTDENVRLPEARER